MKPSTSSVGRQAGSNVTKTNTARPTSRSATKNDAKKENLIQRLIPNIFKKHNKLTKQGNMDSLKKEIEIDEHKLTLDEVCRRYNTSATTGLKDSLAAELLLKNGPNALTPPKQTPKWVKLLKCMLTGFSKLLWVAAFFCFISFIVANQQDPTTTLDNVWLGSALVVVVVLTGIFQFYQENKSDKIMESFKNMIPQEATVIRNGQKSVIPAANLVLGDYILIASGEKVPADLRIIKSDGLKVDNSSLTGEAEPQSRSPDFTHENPLESKNIAFFSTFIVEGEGAGIVIKTGDNTAMGRIASLASGLGDNKTHLAVEIEHFVHIVTIVAFTFGITFFAIMMGIGYNVITAIVFLIGVVVSNVPEGLIACVTVCLALTAKRMAKKNCLVKHLEAVEALGSVGIICSDKTGTLTMNRMTVSHMWVGNKIVEVNITDSNNMHAVLNRAFEQDAAVPYSAKSNDTFDAKSSFDWSKLIRCAMLCNRSQFKPEEENMKKEIWKRACTGDASEQALFQYTEVSKGSVMEYRAANRKIIEIPFNSTNKFQVSIHETVEHQEQGYLLVMKGAPERMLERSSHILVNGETLELTSDWVIAFNEAYEALGGMGERVLGFCDLRLDPNVYNQDFKFDIENINFPVKNLRFLGFFSLIDPPKPSVPEAVAKCRDAGIRVFMVTGDHPITAKAIAHSVNIISQETKEDISKRLRIPVEQVNPRDARACVVHGSSLVNMSAEDLDSIINNHDEIVFARTSPQQKLIIVEACQRTKQLVGVTGDGVNDSPAMKRADIGISMGITGSDVSKQVADMVLLDDNFATIVNGIEEGRLIFDNIGKIVCYTFTKNLTELCPFIFYILTGSPVALTTITMLCLDLGTDILPSISLAYEKAERGIMQRPPRDPVNDKMTNSKMVSACYGQIAAIQATAGFFVYYVAYAECGFWPSRILGARSYWESTSINDFQDSYGQEWTYDQRMIMQKHTQACYFFGTVTCQLANILINKTKKDSLFRHGLGNYHMNAAIIFTLGLAAFLINVPGLNNAFNMYPLKGLWYLPALPFGIYIFGYTEIRKLLCRRFPKSWYDQEFTW